MLSVIVLPESHYLEAFGALLYAAELTEQRTAHHPDTWFKPAGINFELHPPLSKAEPLLNYRAMMNNKKEIVDGASYILGIDAGSTTTKAVLMNVAESSVDASHYLR